MSHFLLAARGGAVFSRFTSQFKKRFQRSRMWCPRSVMLWLLVLTMPNRKNTYRPALRKVGALGRRYFGWAKAPSLASIAEARKKLSVSTCRELLHTVAAQVDDCCGPRQLFQGRRLIAFDGTRLITQHGKDTTSKLLRYPRGNGSLTHYPQALMVMAVDIERRLPLDWVVTGKGMGETKALELLLDTIAIQPGDIAVFGRGYTSKKLYAALRKRGIDVVIRMKTEGKTCWKELREFTKQKKKNGVVSMTFVKEKGKEQQEPMRARFVERNKKPGPAKKGQKKERMVLLTSLEEVDGFDRPALLKMYQARWGVETLFRELKSFLDVEPFHGKTVQSCEQEIAASLIWMALAAHLQAEAESRMQNRRVLRSDCLRYAADRVDALLRNGSPPGNFEDDIEALIQLSSYAGSTKTRSFPRECKMPYGRSVSRGRAK